MKKIVIVLLILSMTALLFVGCDSGKSEEIKVLSGTGEGFHGPLSVDVTLTGDKITAIEMTEFNDTEGVGDVGVNTLIDVVVEKGTIDDVEAVAGATYSTTGAIQAINDALSKK